MALPVLVNSLALLPSSSVVSARTAGMVPLPTDLLYIYLGFAAANGLATANATGSYTAPVSSGFLVGGICFDGANVWTADNDGISPPFGISQTFTQWNDSTRLPITTITLAATTGNGSTSGDCVAWNGKVWQLANTTGTGPPQLIANDLSTIPLLPFAAVMDDSRLLVAGGHLYYFETELVLGSPVIYLIVDGITKIATTLPATNLPVAINGVAGTAWDGTNIWVALPTSNQIAKVQTDGTVLALYSAGVPPSPWAIAVDFTGLVWLGNFENGGGTVAAALALFDLTGALQTTFAYGTIAGIGNIVSDSFTDSIWVVWHPPGTVEQLDQYQFPAGPAAGKFVGTFVGILTAGNIAGGTR
jgi:hypothetical protein